MVAAHRLPIVEAPLAVEKGLERMWDSEVGAHGLSSCGSQVLEHSLSSCGAQA